MPMKGNKSIRQMWNSYKFEVIPIDAPRIQIQECRRGFLAGAQSLFHLIAFVIETPEQLEQLRLEIEQMIEEEKNERRNDARTSSNFS